MISCTPDGTFVEFEMQRVSQNCLQRVSIPLELYLKLVEESSDLAGLRLKIIETAHQMSENAKRDRAAELGHSRLGVRRVAAGVSE